MTHFYTAIDLSFPLKNTAKELPPPTFIVVGINIANKKQSKFFILG